MKQLKVLLLVLFLSLGVNNYAQVQERIRVACIGNSITYGAKIKDRIKDAYPEQLSRMLGENYDVRNFGVSGRTLLSKGNMPYIETNAYKNALEFNPNIVIIKLGTNDSKPYNWEFAKEFKDDYLKLIESFQKLETKPSIYLCLAVPVFKSGMAINDLIVKHQINPLIAGLAKEHNLKLIDLFTPFVNKGNLFPDNIHPNAEGAGEMAKIIYKELIGKEGVLVQQPFPGKKTKWKGFDKYDFTFEGKDATIVRPDKPLQDLPWVWRARFFNWHSEMDSILVSEGYHLAYINTNGQFGSPKSMNTWDHFYKYLINSHHFNKKAALEGVSRGGLFIYNWAKKYPQRVSCIYAEAPVCDFKTWPGGFGSSIGSLKDWEQLKIEYGFKTDEEALNYKDNPVDNLDALAKAKVPILHMISLTDSVVNPRENSHVLINRYIELGGIATVIPCTKDKQTLHGHHFTIETPRLGADFIKYHSIEKPQLLNSGKYHKVRGGIRNSLIKFEHKKKGRVAFLGGSITYNGGWRDSISNYLQNRFPKTEFEFIEAGIPSLGSTPAAFRMNRDVFKGTSIDLLFAEAAVNDATNGRTDTEQIRAMEGIVRHTRLVDPTTDIIMMHFVDPGKMNIYRKEDSNPRVITNHEIVASYYNVPSINLAKEVTDRIDSGEFTWKDDFINLHPSPFGQNVYYQSIKTLFENAWNVQAEANESLKNYSLPNPIKELNYSNGNLIDIKKAKISGGWKIIDKWEPSDGKQTRKYYTNIPMLVGDNVSGKVELKFKGNTIGIVTVTGPDAGIFEYRIDKNNWTEFDMRKHANKSLHLPRYYTLASDLSDGNHKLELRMKQPSDASGTSFACRIKCFYVNLEEEVLKE